MIAYLETTDRPDRIANFVDMGGSPPCPARFFSGKCSRRTEVYVLR